MTVAPSGGERISILYETDGGVAEILGGSEAMRTLPWLFRQEPSNSGPGAQLASNDQRMTKISGAALFRKPSAAAMRDMLRNAVDRTCVTPAGVNTCGAHRVGVDEIGTEWGADSDAEAYSPNSPAARLRAAMRELWTMPHPGGGTYAQRVHLYVAPGVSTSIAAGRGFDRTKGEDGKERFRNFAGLMPVFRRAGGVWLEMYHYPKGSRTRQAFSATEWRRVPDTLAAFMRDRADIPGAPSPRSVLHFVMTGGPMPGGTCPPEDGMACQWRAAQSGALNLAILGNGPAAFKITGADAIAYGQQFRGFFALG